jgi:cytochrome d ubiquinol oxidase subunit II
MSKADVVAAVLWAAVTLYALLAGADFGAGFWDLIAGGPERGARPRRFMDRIVTPVWEANHVWLIFMLVVTWTAFPGAFAAIFSTLFVPLCLVAVGIILRGSGFAFRHVAQGVPAKRALGATFAGASLLTPFFMGTVVGAIATGRVPATGHGDRLTSWLNVSSIAIGVLFVGTCAYIAAVYLTNDARRAGDAEIEAYFRRRAIAAAAAAGALAALGLLVLRAHARPLFDDLLGDALPLVVLSGVCGAAVLVQLLRRGRGTRPLAIAAVAAVIWAWAVAQRPDLLPGVLSINEAAAPSPTLDALFVVVAAAVVFVVPALVVLVSLQQREALGDPDDSA